MIKFWIINILKKIIIFEREFPINVVRAKKLGFNFKNWQDEKLQNKNVFIQLILNELDIDLSDLNTKDEKANFSNQDKLEDYDFLKNNTLPITNLKLSEDNFLWPLIIIEKNKNLYCGLPLIQNSSKRLIDHLSISMAFTTLKALINFNVRESQLQNLEMFICNHLPFGQLMFFPTVNITSSLNINKNKPYIYFCVTEYITSCSNKNEVIYGTLTIENNKEVGDNAKLILSLKESQQLNFILSPSCQKKIDDKNNISLQIKLNDLGAKFLYYFCDTTLFKPFLTYDYIVTRSHSQKLQYKIEIVLNLNIKRNMIFNYLNVVFPNCFIDKTAKLNNSSISLGLLSLEKNGLVWFIGNKLPKNDNLKLILEVTSLKTDISFTEANLTFQTDNFNYGFPKINSESINILDSNLKQTFIFQYNFNTINYKLIPSLV